MASLKGNIILNYINTFTGIIFPVITFPYSSRILMPEGIGTVNFLQSIINYIVLFTSLGIPMYAVREVAKYRDNVEYRNKVTMEILFLSILLCIIGYISVLILGLYVPQINKNISIFYILGLTVVFNCIGVHWFYQAVEDFKFITIRTTIFRFISLLSLFLFVKDENDVLIYASISVITSVGSNIINFIHLRHYIDFSSVSIKNIISNRFFKHLKPALQIFVLNLITSIYVNLNSVMLGFLQNEESVGLYTAGVKISHLLLSMVTSAGTVMIPRCSNLIANGLFEEFKEVVIKACRLVLCLALPFSVGIILLGSQIIYLFCGPEFNASIGVLYWTAPIIVFIGITNVIGIQILYPQNKENIVIWSVIGGALFNVILNLYLIPHYAEIGAAIATFVAEFIVLVIQIIVGRRFIPFNLSDIKLANYIIGCIIMSLACVLLLLLLSNIWSQIVFSVIIGGSVYLLYLFKRKDIIVKSFFKYIIK